MIQKINKQEKSINIGDVAPTVAKIPIKKRGQTYYDNKRKRKMRLKLTTSQ